MGLIEHDVLLGWYPARFGAFLISHDASSLPFFSCLANNQAFSSCKQPWNRVNVAWLRCALWEGFTMLEERSTILQLPKLALV
jgi:hypothetical protein